MTLCLRNRQRVCPIDLRLIRRILRYLLDHHFQARDYELCFHFVEASEMAGVNEKHLGHIGPTDVITFDHRPLEGRVTRVPVTRVPIEPVGDKIRDSCNSSLHGEIFICPEAAVSQAKEFRTSWQEEVVRYAIHGLLHLQGHDDLAAGPRRKMKRAEERLLAEVGEHFAIARLQRVRLR